MGFDKFFKNFIEKVPETSATANAPKSNPSVVSAIPANTDFPMPPPAAMLSDEPVEQQYLDHFMQFLEKNNIAGLDYWEFANTLHKTYEKNGAVLSEQNLYDMVLTMFETQGITSATLIQTAQKYLELITAHKKEFDSFLSNEGSKTLQDKKTENTQLEQKNAAALTQIATLQQQILSLQTSVATNNTTMETNKTFIDEETQKNKGKKVKFENAFSVVVEKINGDIQKIKTYSNK